MIFDNILFKHLFDWNNHIHRDLLRFVCVLRVLPCTWSVLYVFTAILSAGLSLLRNY